MTLFMTRVSYSTEAWKTQIENPQDREAALRAMAESKGSKLIGFYYIFGEYDLLVIQDAPDQVTAAALLIAVAGSGSVSKSETNVLMSASEGLEAIRRASDSGYTPPGS